MAGIQGFSDTTTTTPANSGIYSAPPRRTRTISASTTAIGDTTTRQQFTRTQTNNTTTAQNREHFYQNHDQMWRYSRPSSLEQELERRNLQKLQLNENNNHVDAGVNDEHDDDGGKGNRSNLSKNSSSEDEGGDLRPNKLFPVLSERDELLRKVRSVLNKVSNVNYSRLRKRWLSLMPLGVDEEKASDDGGEARLSISQIGEVLRMVISKALDDTIYMHIYAGLLGYVVARKPGDISSKIQSLINSQLQSELKKLTTDKELALFHRSTPRVDLTRRKKVNLHRFIAELYCEKACTSRFLYERVTDLMIVNNPLDIDETVECLCVVMTFAGSKLELVRKPWVETIFAKLIHHQNESPQLISKRISFMILDLVEMKASGWSPHNKWWSPSLQRAPERERTQSSPSPSSTRATSTTANKSPEMVPLRQAQDQQQGPDKPRKEPRKKKFYRNNSPRSRTRSEGSSSGSSSSSSGSGSGINNGNATKGRFPLPVPPSPDTNYVSVRPSLQQKTLRATAKPGETQQTQQQQQEDHHPGSDTIVQG